MSKHLAILALLLLALPGCFGAAVGTALVADEFSEHDASERARLRWTRHWRSEGWSEQRIRDHIKATEPEWWAALEYERKAKARKAKAIADEKARVAGSRY